MIKKLTYSLFLLFILLAACTKEKLPLPVPKTNETTFGASDTNYVELSPVWNQASLGVSLQNPQDITIGRDGLVFVADRGNDRVLVFSKAGARQTHHGLDAIHLPHPQSISIDSKLNVLISNRSDTLYCWSQYLNFAEIDSVADAAVFYDAAHDSLVQLTFSEFVERTAAGETELELREILFRKDAALLERIRSVYPMYIAEQSEARINGVAAGAYASERVYITESTFDKISELALTPEYAVKTSFDVVLFRYRAIHVRDIASFGSGAGTVDDPWAIEVDAEGDVYFTQLGGNFRVQKLTAPKFTSAYVLGVHDIMDLDRFDAPMDVTLDGLNDIFVIDAGKRIVSKFDNGGRRAGQEARLGKKGLATAQFNDGRGIMVEDNIVYVVESGENRIRRFQYSVSDSDIPDDDKKP